MGTRTHRVASALAPLRCPSCLNAYTAATGHEQAPSHDDWGICFYCGHLHAHVIGPLGHGVRALTADELAEADSREDIRRLRAARHESYTPHQMVDLALPREEPTT